MSTLGDADFTALYPFMSAENGDRGDHDDEAVLEEVRRSIAGKAEQIVALRELVADRLGAELAACAQAMARAFSAGGRLFAFGNGGSGTDAQALAQLFSHPPAGGAGEPPVRVRQLPAFCLAQDAAVLTALGNDIGHEAVFSRQLAAFGRRGDVAVGLSTSGGSANVLRALVEARRLGMTTVGVAGGDGGDMASCDAIDHLFVVPSASVHRIQEAQTTLCHVLWELVQREAAR
ncbi:D-sedoheptulose-7-phosphate isomerase [Thermostaphylospora chromogena]|uniref:D-sedoheptulose 7-phosphate isomerase n=1 Tax=Thermostaphylospora chromogena TaxID=35622 RepID=A0A1H1H5E6_9ACTN|nr:SIS domain-containing protein [Thermostaphylospora chromogena]SDR20599.1 D-sedoheptulose 7-phosphate isomerase [Thermostaphylospora chromogena]